LRLPVVSSISVLFSFIRNRPTVVLTNENSVVIPCYNEKATIEALIQAVRGAPVDDIEIIVVDDCSTDGTSDVLHRVPAAVLGLVFLSGGASRRVAFRAGRDVSYPWVTPGPSRTRQRGWTADLLGTPSYFAFEQIRVIFLSWPLSGFALQSGNGLCFRTGATVCGQARGAAASVPGPRTPVADGFGPIHT
jgi:cellulose synthase/poly-beta-1,6-N-acetylglucosamine synthase-like glycosyltransferase